jgi:hypothetical protein
MDMTSLTIDAARSGVQERKTTALALAEAHYARIQKEDGEIGAFLTLCKERALEQADRIDHMAAEGKPLPPLAGVPVAIKDVMSTRGVRTTAGSKILSHYIPPYDCTAVARMEAAGAVVLGKTNCDEFAMGSSNENSAFHPVHNPRDLSRVPGGSSGGSAAGIVLRRGGFDADVWTRLALRPDCVCIIARSHRTIGQDGEGRRDCAAYDCRARSDGFNVGRFAGAGLRCRAGQARARAEAGRGERIFRRGSRR